MASIKDLNITKKFVNTGLQLGGATLNALFPNEIEYYFISLELTNSDGNMIDYFIFPVMPENIVRPMQKRINTKQAINSITTITSDSFVPFDLQIKGNFGRAFKIIIAKEPVVFTALRYSMKAGIFSKTSIFSDIKQTGKEFNPAIKTGYGASKILQSIIDKSDGRDDKGAFNLYFYNPAFGESYLVVPTANPLTFTQDEGKNMIWQYTMNLKVIAPLTSLKNQKDIQKKTFFMNSFSQIQKSMNTTASTIKKLIL